MCVCLLESLGWDQLAVEPGGGGEREDELAEVSNDRGSRSCREEPTMAHFQDSFWVSARDLVKLAG